MSRTDRTLIAPLLSEHFPTMKAASSDEWHGFLNAVTGLNIEIDESNGTAFDKWRQALAEQKALPVWNITEARKEQIRIRGEELKRKEEDRVEALPAKLAALRVSAPTKTAEQLIADTKAAVK
jgi:hypothetical protein